MQSLQGINCLQIKLNLNEIIRISYRVNFNVFRLTSYHEVNIVPVGEQELLEHSNNVGETALTHEGKRLGSACGPKVPIEHFGFFHPLGLQNFIFSRIIGVILEQEVVGVGLIPPQKGVLKLLSLFNHCWVEGGACDQ